MCIYCRSIKPPLTDEHTLADGFGGRVVLPKASCELCREMTRQFEELVMRGMVWPLRHALNMHARKRPLPDVIDTWVPQTDGSASKTRLPPRDIVLKAMFLRFLRPPGLIINAPRDAEPEFDYMGVIDPEAMERARARGEDGVSAFIHEKAFIRMLAKIAHSQAVGLYGLDGFEAFLPGIIRDDDPHWAYLIGHGNAGDDEEYADQEHWIEIGRNRVSDIICARIRLFARVNAPTYMVVIGRKAVGWRLGTHEQPPLPGGNIPLGLVR